ncbi:uncharacterized protein LOC114257381 [Camellia sinensis]|uniref:uncharacterized protein LOC114257381 n=1 Tax=Camellia sinensis TaxID=4442 RepID=UPI0010365494|nr:uncharacterized protein LOC114257381 [Camellia sinensis]
MECVRIREKRKKGKIKKLVSDGKVELLMMQETKTKSMNDYFVRSLWPSENFEFMLVDSDGSAEGLICVWNPEVFQLKDCCSTRNFILLSGVFHQSFECVVVNLYAPNEVIRRKQLWDLIINIRPLFNIPWCIGDDFNVIQRISERRGCIRTDREMNDFNKFIDRMEFLDMPMLGRNFTWFNSFEGDRWSRIDRFLVNFIWREKFRLKLWGLLRSISDHCSLLLMEDDRNWGPRPFRFLNA